MLASRLPEDTGKVYRLIMKNPKVDQNNILGPYFEMILCAKWSVVLYPVTIVEVTIKQCTKISSAVIARSTML